MDMKINRDDVIRGREIILEIRRSLNSRTAHVIKQRLQELENILSNVTFTKGYKELGKELVEEYNRKGRELI